MRVLSVVGARPQFIKAAPIVKALAEAAGVSILVHTGQHYDYELSQIFFDEMGISSPEINLGVGSSSHGRQTGEMLIRIEEVLLAQGPDLVLVYGDTNSTLAGALAACKLRIPLAHVEAGLRSFDRHMPEEHNRVLTDHCSDVLLCPTQTAVDNLAREGIVEGVHQVGDVMCDALFMFLAMAEERSTILSRMELKPGSYLLATIHRVRNTDDPENLASILAAFQGLDERVVFPAHPRTLKTIQSSQRLGGLLRDASQVRMIDAVGYLDMLVLEKNARMILTDSGGVQKESYLLHVPCVTLRQETEWVETVEAGWNVLTGADENQILQAVRTFAPPSEHPDLYGDGRAAERIVGVILDRGSSGSSTKLRVRV